MADDDRTAGGPGTTDPRVAHLTGIRAGAARIIVTARPTGQHGRGTNAIVPRVVRPIEGAID